MIPPVSTLTKASSRSKLYAVNQDAASLWSSQGLCHGRGTGFLQVEDFEPFHISAYAFEKDRAFRFDCNDTPLVRRESFDGATWRHCVVRSRGHWENGDCRSMSYLDVITIEADRQTCTYVWRGFPSRDLHKMEQFLQTRPVIEIRRDVDAAVVATPKAKRRCPAFVWHCLSGLAVAAGCLFLACLKPDAEPRIEFLPKWRL